MYCNVLNKCRKLKKKQNIIYFLKTLSVSIVYMVMNIKIKYLKKKNQLKY